MKKIVNKINMALVGIMCVGPAMADVNENSMCLLLKDLHGVFNMLRIVAFIGAAFIIANWAWEFITSGKFEVKTLKDKGTAMLVGFVLLFSVGMILNFLLSSAGQEAMGCAYQELITW